MLFDCKTFFKTNIFYFLLLLIRKTIVSKVCLKYIVSGEEKMFSVLSDSLLSCMNIMGINHKTQRDIMDN